jgi:NADP-dependent 3-hydroxy acid dehydrogenase YdfG
MTPASQPQPLDKTIVVTGASAGIGAAFARLAGSHGARLVLAARREHELAEVAREAGGNAITVVADVTHRKSVERVLGAAIERFGHVDVWINNAAAASPGRSPSSPTRTSTT